MVDIINSLNEERLVVFVSQDEVSTKLSMEARLAIEKLGSTLIHDLGWRDSWAFIGQVRRGGSARDSSCSLGALYSS